MLFRSSANAIPRMKDKTGAVQRRLVIVPFEAKFTPDDADFRPYIKDELCEQEPMEYLIRLALDGLKRVLRNAKFTTSKRVEGQLEEYEENNNPIIGFVEEVGLDSIENEPTKDVFFKYNVYCNRNNLNPLSNIEFSRQITRRFGFTVKNQRRNGKQTKIFVKGGDS